MGLSVFGPTRHAGQEPMGNRSIVATSPLPPDVRICPALEGCGASAAVGGCRQTGSSSHAATRSRPGGAVRFARTAVGAGLLLALVTAPAALAADYPPPSDDQG